MQIIDYSYLHGTEDRETYIAIPELDRYKSSVKQFIKLADLNIILYKPTAFLYVDGFSTAQSESGINNSDTSQYVPALKSGSSYIMHEWIYTFKNKEHLVHANIISSTCAAGIQAVHEAKLLLDSKTVDEVIIIGCERTTVDTIRLFKELRMNIKCGDGFFYIKLSNEVNSVFPIGIHDVKWKYAYNKNPFMFTKDTIDSLSPDYKIDFIKLHGTGTHSNTEAESGLEHLGSPILYKHKVGHTQGISSLLETCIMLDDMDIKGKILVVANGVSGFYGAFTVLK